MPDEPRAADAEPTSDPLEERLRSFEAFDRLIAENISRSGAMVREAIELRERARREIAAERATLADVITGERDRARAEAMARQADTHATISAALADIEILRAEMSVVAARLRSVVAPIADTAGAVLAPSVADRPAPIADAPAAEEPAALADEEPDAAEPAAEVAAESPPAAALTAGDEALSPEPAAQEPPTDALVDGDADHDADSDHDAGTTGADADLCVGGSLTVVVQNIRRASIASALQRHLAAQDGIAAVEPREFADGIFRLHLVLDGPFDLASLREWAADADATYDRPAPAFVTITIAA